MTRVIMTAAISLLWATQACLGQDGEQTQVSDLAKQAGLVLRRNCYRCHKGEGSESGYAFNATDVESMIEDGMLVEGEHEDSEIYTTMFAGRMPPKNRPQLPRPSAADIEIIKKWIAEGPAEIPKPTTRELISLKSQLTAIRSDLQKRRREDRLNIRYFTLTHLHNDRTADQELLNTTKLALTKTLNSLSWESLMVTPESIVDTETIYAVDISKLGWTRKHWDAVSQAYSYGLAYGSMEDPELKEIDDDIQDLRGGDRTAVSLRADWLIAVATKPPLYNQLMFDLILPELVKRPANPQDLSNPKTMTDKDLEQFLGVAVRKNILSGDVARSGYTESGISGQNRMIERHSMRSGGFYWKSYDFLSSNRTAILSEFPLGPVMPDSPFKDLAFEHDGGEVIFSLPNGLQGYLLLDGKGNRIDVGPIEVVGDSLKTSGNEQIVNGVSCIACHRVGMIEAPTDEVRKFSSSVGQARRKVFELYPEEADFRKLVAKDREVFVRALHAALDKLAGDSNIEEMPEPVGEVARRYHLEPMKIETVAAELQITVERLRASLEADPRLKQLGLRILLRDGGTIKRAAWESPASFPLMKQAARQFGYDPR